MPVPAWKDLRDVATRTLHLKKKKKEKFFDKDIYTIRDESK